MTDVRKRAQAVMREHVIGADVFDLHIDAMLAFAAEEVKTERERCVRIINDMDLASYPYTKCFGSEYIAAINARALVVSAPNASTPPATAHVISEPSQEGLRQGGVAGLAPIGDALPAFKVVEADFARKLECQRDAERALRVAAEETMVYQHKGLEEETALRETAEAERDHWKQICLDLTDDAECLPECSGTGHSNDCPMISAANYCKSLQSRVSILEEELKQYKQDNGILEREHDC